MAERQLPKLNVAGSIPVSRSKARLKSKTPQEICGVSLLSLAFSELQFASSVPSAAYALRALGPQA